ncbi:MAG: prepilin-type N-terminal cleavage/methylation domain-containing protein [Candidatus Omnitrophota bacterium]|jgi:prepilin-type N-terminal cleavage/methylation domain-containing protein|nr:MAG: prepilin-type N-terminal cleavage/methylation domain-containing protein [Candidatus Omnitrophota bacterium]
MKNEYNRGVTLIEIVVVITLLAVLAGAVGMQFHPDSANTDGAAALIQAHLLRAKQLAMTTRQWVGLRFSPSDKKYDGIAIPVESGQPDPFRDDPLTVNLNVNRLATDFESDAILFNGRGAPISPSGIPYNSPKTITLGANQEVRQIVIEPMTGYIHE